MDFSSDQGSLCSNAREGCGGGKERCSLLVKFYAAEQGQGPLIDSTHLEGSSPPSVFIGRFSYPKVYIGPMLPLPLGTHDLMDHP